MDSQTHITIGTAGDEETLREVAGVVHMKIPSKQSYQLLIIIGTCNIIDPDTQMVCFVQQTGQVIHK